MMNEEVRRIMTDEPYTIGPEDNIAEASTFLMRNRVHHIPVVDSRNVLIGLVTTYDLWKKMEENADVSNLKVKDVMNTNIIKITPIDKVGTAAELFMDRRFHALPVVNLRGELKGVVTSYDVLRYTLKREYNHAILYKEVLDN